MNNHPPLPDSMTLTEAAIALTVRTGMDWTARHVLGRAVHHEIQINARIGHAVRLVRSEPLEGEQNELSAPAGCLVPLSSKAVLALLNAGEAGFDGWERPKKIDFFGVPADVWAMGWELAPGEAAPIVRFDDCRVSAAGVIQLASKYTAPAQTAAEPVPVGTESASGGVKPDKAAPLPLTTRDIAVCFAGLRWDEKQWKKPLGDKPKWLAACIVIPGVQGVSETRWNPVYIGAALVHNGHAKPNSVRAKFQVEQRLKPWLETWETYEADNFDTE